MKLSECRDFPKAIKILTPCGLVVAFCVLPLSTLSMFFYRTELKLTEAQSMLLHHLTEALDLVSTTVGAIVADSYTGKWRLIVAGKLLLLIHHPFIALSAVSGHGVPQLSLYVTGKILGALLAVHATTVTPFLAEQFSMPQQQEVYRVYLTVLYYCNNLIICASYAVVPKLAEMRCLGQQTCYPLVFWQAQASTVLYTIVFLGCGRLFVKKEPERNVLVEAAVRVKRALVGRAEWRGRERPKHWLDYGGECDDDDFREDLKQYLRMCRFVPPTVFMWTLYLQYNSRWVYQASKMDTRLWGGLSVHPAQVTVLNPVLVVVFLPVVEFVVYPALNKFNMLTTTLQRVCTAYTFIGLSFVVAGVVQTAVERTYPDPLPKGEARLRIYNPTKDEAVYSEPTVLGSGVVKPLSVAEFRLSGHGGVPLEVVVGGRPSSVEPRAGVGVSYAVTAGGGLRRLGESDNDLKSGDGRPKVRVVCADDPCPGRYLAFRTAEDENVLDPAAAEAPYLELHGSGPYDVYLGERPLLRGAEVLTGGVYALLVAGGGTEGRLLTVTPPNSVSLVWIVPQYALLTLGEVLHTVAHNIFVYTQSPPSMRALVNTTFRATNSVANLFVSVIAIMELTSLSTEYFAYGVLMVMVTALFCLLSTFYQYRDVRD